MKVILYPVYTNSPGSSRAYHEASWWALDEDGRAWGGPCRTKGVLAEELKDLNRRVREGEYSPPLRILRERKGGARR